MENKLGEGEEFLKRSLSLHGHRTSISLERAFWVALEGAAASQNISLIQLIRDVDTRRKGGLASALRLYVLAFVTEGAKNIAKTI